jgi:hypothetical protein
MRNSGPCFACAPTLGSVAGGRFLPASRRFRTPAGGLAVIGGWALLVIGWAAITRYGDAARLPNVLEAALILSAAGSYLITFVYLLLALGGVRLLLADRARGGLWWKLPVVLAALVVPILSFDGSLNPFPRYPNDIGAFLAAASVLIAIGWYGALRVWRAPLVGAAALHAEIVTASPAPSPAGVEQ